MLNIHCKDWCWSWNSSTLATSCEELTHWKRPWCWERLKVGGEGYNGEWDGWMASQTQWACVWVTSGVGDGQEGLACCSPWGHKESDTTEWLNWTELKYANKSLPHDSMQKITKIEYYTPVLELFFVFQVILSLLLIDGPLFQTLCFGKNT